MKRWLPAIIVGLAVASLVRFAAMADDLHAFGRGSWQEIRKAHAGAPVVVHFWGVTCGPCRAEMAQWGTFLKTRADLRLVMIDADLVPNAPAAVKTMLENNGLNAAENWIFDDDFVARLRYEIDPHWQGEIPRTLLITADGTTTTIEGVADLDAVRSWLDRQASLTPVR